MAGGQTPFADTALFALATDTRRDVLPPMERAFPTMALFRRALLSKSGDEQCAGTCPELTVRTAKVGDCGMDIVTHISFRSPSIHGTAGASIMCWSTHRWVSGVSRSVLSGVSGRLGPRASTRLVLCTPRFQPLIGM
jgi:hypothetical protein